MVDTTAILMVATTVLSGSAAGTGLDISMLGTRDGCEQTTRDEHGLLSNLIRPQEGPSQDSAAYLHIL